MKKIMLIACPLLATCLGIVLWQMGLTPAIAWTAGITVLVANWWISEPIPIPATSLIPLALFPLVGVWMPTKSVKPTGTSSYC